METTFSRPQPSVVNGDAVIDDSAIDVAPVEVPELRSDSDDDGWNNDTTEVAFADLNRRYASGPGKDFQDQKFFGDQEYPQLKIYDIPAGCESQAVRRECEVCGPVQSFKFIPGKWDGASAHAFVAFKSSPSAAKALEHINSLPLGIRAKPDKTKEQKTKEEEERRRVNETLRSCGYTNVRDNPRESDRLFCNHCGRDDKHFEILRCTGCKKAAYCTKACQSRDWSAHMRECDERLDKLKRSREDEKAAAAAKFDAPTFKGFNEDDFAASRNALVDLTPSTPGIVWGVTNPDLFGVISEDDDPLDYQLLTTLIQDFVEAKSVFALVENPAAGELILTRCVEEEQYGRAVVLEDDGWEGSEETVEAGVSDAAPTKEDGDLQRIDSKKGSEKGMNEQTNSESVVNLWFIDFGCLQLRTPLKDLIPIRDFWDDLTRIQKMPLNESLRVKKFKELPARLIPCYLHGADPRSGESRRLVPYSADQESLAITWSPETISTLKRFTSLTLDVSVKDTVPGGESSSSMTHRTLPRFPFTHWGVELTKDLGADLFLNVGSSFYDRKWADLLDLEEEEEEVEEEEEIFPRTLPRDVPHLPLEDGAVVKTHYESPTNFFVVSQNGGAAELKRMKEPIDRSVENQTPFGLKEVKPMVGDLVLASYQCLLYRAVVLAFADEDCVEVNFIDWGNTELVSLDLVYEASPEIASFRCPSSRCSLSPVELRIPGAYDVAQRILSPEAADEFRIKIISHSVEEEGAANVNDAAAAAPSPTYRHPLCHVTLIDSLGRRSRDIVENLNNMPRLKDVKPRRDLFMKKFPCYIHSGRWNDNATATDPPTDDAAAATTAAAASTSSSVDFVAVPKEENAKLIRLNADLDELYGVVKAEDYFYPRSGQIVVGKDREGVVMRYSVVRDVGFEDDDAEVLSLDHGYRDTVLASSLRRLPPDGILMNLPLQSLRCRLKDAPPSGSQESAAIFDLIEVSAKNSREIFCEIDRITDGVFWVHLYVDGRKLDRCVD